MTARRRKTRGFTLVELMVVVTITTVIASIAIMSMRKSRSEGDSDAWANTVRNLVNQARRRAVATNATYLLDIRRTQAQWCRCTDSTTTTCPNKTSGMENSPITYAGPDAITAAWAKQADIQLPGQTYAAASRTTLSTSTDVASIYFGPSGTAAYSWANAQSGNIPLGVTLYVRASNTTTKSDSQSQKQRKVIVYGVSGRPRIIDTW